MHTFRIALFALMVVLVLPSVSSAHGTGITYSATTTTETGEMRLIDVDYSDFTVYAGTFGRFDFGLFSDAERTKAVPFSDLWVRIEEKGADGARGKQLFAGAIAHKEFGGSGFSIVFPKEGEYVLSVRYNDESGGGIGRTVAEAEFPITVVADRDAPAFYLLPSFWMGAVAGLLLAIFGVVGIVVRSRFFKGASA